MTLEHEILAAAFAIAADGQSFRYLLDTHYRMQIDAAWRQLLKRTERLRQEPRPRGH